jgi:hypothetical protein
MDSETAGVELQKRNVPVHESFVVESNQTVSVVNIQDIIDILHR